MKRQARIYVLCHLFYLIEGSMVLWTSLIILLRIPRWWQQNIKARNGFLVTFSVGGFICKHYDLHQLEYVNCPLFSYLTLPTRSLFIYLFFNDSPLATLVSPKCLILVFKKSDLNQFFGFPFSFGARDEYA